jgi:predicted phage terminase large subunit-like protein
VFPKAKEVPSLTDFGRFGEALSTLVKDLPLEDLVAFTEELGYVNNWHHVDWYDLVVHSGHRNILVLGPRSHAKTECLTVNLPCWLLGRDRNTRILIISNTATQASAVVRQIRIRFETNQAYRGLFGDLEEGSQVWSDEALQVKRDKDLKDPSISGVGILGPIVGRRANWIICFDDKTEILTRDGFKYFKDVSDEDNIATLDKDDCLEYQKPLRIIRNDWHGELVTFTSPHIDFAVTPEHNLYVAHKGRKGWGAYRLSPASELYGLKTLRFKKDANWKGRRIETITIPEYRVDWTSGNGAHRSKLFKERNIVADAFLEILGFWVAEGSLGFRNRGHPSTVRFAQNEGDHLDFLLSALDRAGLKYRVRDRSCDAKAKDVALHDSQLAQFVYINFRHGAENKVVPVWVKELCPEQLRLFFDAYMRGDGTRQGDCALTTSKKLADDLSEIALKIGYSASVRKQQGHIIRGKYLGKETYVISINKHKTRPHIRDSGRSGWARIVYDGSVYCVTVPNGLIYVRHNGKTMWAGNCDDVVDRENVATSYQRDKVESWIKEVVMPVLEPDGKMIVVGSTYHYDDLYARLEKSAEWTVRKYKAIQDDGSALWPARWPLEKLEQRKREMGTLLFNSQYQCDPSGLQGLFFKESWLKYYVTLPTGLRIYEGIDPAISENPEADFFVIFTLGIDQANEYYLLDIVRERLDFPSQIKSITNRAASDFPWGKPLKIGVEAVAYQRALSQQVYKLTGLPIVEVKTSSNKLDRMARRTPIFEAGHFHVPAKGSRITELFLEEYLRFPKGEHDDILDGMDLAFEASTQPIRPRYQSVVF